MAQMKVDHVGGIDIFVDESGKFFAEIDGKVVRRASKSALRRLIRQTLNPVKVIVFSLWGQWHLTTAEITHMTRSSYRTKSGTSFSKYGDKLFVYDEEAEAKLKDILIGGSSGTGGSSTARLTPDGRNSPSPRFSASCGT